MAVAAKVLQLCWHILSLQLLFAYMMKLRAQLTGLGGPRDAACMGLEYGRLVKASAVAPPPVQLQPAPKRVHRRRCRTNRRWTNRRRTNRRRTLRWRVRCGILHRRRRCPAHRRIRVRSRNKSGPVLHRGRILGRRRFGPGVRVAEPELHLAPAAVAARVPAHSKHTTVVDAQARAHVG